MPRRGRYTNGGPRRSGTVVALLLLAGGCGGGSEAPHDGSASRAADGTVPGERSVTGDAAVESRDDGSAATGAVSGTTPDGGAADMVSGAPDTQVEDAAGDAADLMARADGPAAADGRDAGEPTADGGRSDAAPADGSASSSPDGASLTCSPCTEYGTPMQTGQVSNTTLNALSGIAVSHLNSGVVYVHNDMKNPQFFALNEQGTVLVALTLTGATVQDLEDMAVAPCPAGSCVYLADIGGNLAARSDYAILRTPEPTVQTSQAAMSAGVTFERLVFTYPDGAHNAESLLVDPTLAAIYIITKVEAGMPSTVYRLPSTFGAASVVAQKLVTLTVPGPNDTPATSANPHPCRPGFLLRTNNTLYEFRAAAGATLADAFSATPVTVPVAQEPQGEGVAYTPDGRGYFTTSEGSRPALNRVSCK